MVTVYCCVGLLRQQQMRRMQLLVELLRLALHLVWRRSSYKLVNLGAAILVHLSNLQALKTKVCYIWLFVEERNSDDIISSRIT